MLNTWEISAWGVGTRLLAHFPTIAGGVAGVSLPSSYIYRRYHGSTDTGRVRR